MFPGDKGKAFRSEMDGRSEEEKRIGELTRPKAAGKW